MTTIFAELFSAFGSFASSDSLFLPFIILFPMILCVASGVFGFLKQ